MRFSIVTPSFNQAEFLERSMLSVLAQDVADLEYMVLDAGSTDGSVEIIKKQAGRLAHWRSRPDKGYADALQEGFQQSTGEIMGWLNSDDLLTPWALRTVNSIFLACPEVMWLTSRFPMVMDEADMVVSSRLVEGYNAKAFYRGRNLPIDRRFYSCVIQQESTFWRRSLWEQAGARMDESLRMGGDFELWARFFQHADLYAVGVPLGCFRFQKSSITSTQMDSYTRECAQVLNSYAPRYPKSPELALRRLARKIPKRFWRHTGLAYRAKFVVQEARGTKWRIREEWFV